MELLYPSCCGLDEHEASVVACLVRVITVGTRTKEIKTFATTTGELERLGAWLREAGCTHVAMESTGCCGSRPTTS